MIAPPRHPAPDLWQVEIALPPDFAGEGTAPVARRNWLEEKWGELPPFEPAEDGSLHPAQAAEFFADAFETLSDSVSWFAEGDPDDPGVIWKVLAVFRAPPDRQAVEVALAVAAGAMGCPVPVPDYRRLPPTDWVLANLASFPPIEAGRFYIHGSHDEAPVPAGRIGLTIDAGAAFGSGEHATTQGCLLALDKLLRRRRFRRPLDVGCGSGILGMAAAKALRVRVLATDIDPVAARVTAANARLNGLGALVTARAADGFGSRIIARGRPYDLIFANILARPLTRIAAALAAHLAPDGVAILAGLLDWQERGVLSAYERTGLALAGRLRRRGWTILILSRTPKRSL